MLHLQQFEMSRLKDIARKVVAGFPVPLTKNLAYDRQTTRVMKDALRETSNCIDIGCHKGEVLEEMLALAPKGRHFGFEPIPHYFTELGKKFPANCEFYQVALSDSVGEIQFNYVKTNPAFSGIKQREYPKEEQIELLTVKTDLLDNIIPGDVFIDLIKIDVEGAEMQVLKGGESLIKRCQPIIVFEHGIGAADHYGTHPAEVFDFLTDCGLLVNTMKRWISEKEAFSRAEFEEQFTKQLNYYFMAYPG